MDFNNIPDILRERYKNISGINYGPIKITLLEELNKKCMPLNPAHDSKSYDVFANEFNSIMLTAHFFENLVIFEDRWHEREGYHDFHLKIPEVYFQHPSFNRPPSIDEADASEISRTLVAIKEKLHYSQDQSFILSQLHKLEFLSTYSHLEAYIESLLVEFLNKTPAEAAAKVRREPLPSLMKEVFDCIDPRITYSIATLEKDALKFIDFCRKIRNLHTHNLGVVTEYFFKEGIENEFLCHDTYAETSEPVLYYARPNFSFLDYIFEVGRHVNLTSISQPFRLFAREIVHISEVFCKEKHAD